MLNKNLAILAFSLIAGAGHASDLPLYPFVHTNGSASINAAPDVGEIFMELSSADQQADVAWGAIATRLADVRALLAQQGIASEDIEVQAIARRPRKQDGAASAGAAGFDTLCTLHLTVRDLSTWSAVVAPLMAMPEVTDFSVTFTRSDRRRIETELVANAMADARRKADDLARGAGRQLGQASGIALVPIKNLSTTFGLSSAEGYRQGARGKAPADYTLVAAVRLQQDVDVIFRLK